MKPNSSKVHALKSGEVAFLPFSVGKTIRHSDVQLSRADGVVCNQKVMKTALSNPSGQIERWEFFCPSTHTSCQVEADSWFRARELAMVKLGCSQGQLAFVGKGPSQ